MVFQRAIPKIKYSTGQLKTVTTLLFREHGKPPSAFERRFNVWRLGLVGVRSIGLSGLHRYW